LLPLENVGDYIHSSVVIGGKEGPRWEAIDQVLVHGQERIVRVTFDNEPAV
jgi:hypothetical protein